METFLTSTAVVALAEIGDKTQLLAILLATRFGKPLPIVSGIFAATIANHFLAALLGAQAAAFLDGQWFRTAIGLSFIAMAVWTLVPDRLDDDEGTTHTFARGAFMTTLVAFFLVEMGDKTQIATVALASRFGDALLVTLATTIGMMIANVPAVFLGNALLRRIPLATVRLVAAGLFLLIGVAVLLQATGVGT
ncbi:MAG: TMEM165/GDT1 family protein [Alphaproteobacteria bacterium]|jgi:putative Ca2+/H+ antiporter (TMEM165/GDT1 family)